MRQTVVKKGPNRIQLDSIDFALVGNGLGPDRAGFDKYQAGFWDANRPCGKTNESRVLTNTRRKSVRGRIGAVSPNG